MLNEKLYELKNWKSVIHTTWNPKGPGVIRIHMIPPKFRLFGTAPSVVILNGQDILPLNESWAILLTEFINRVNAYGPHEMDEETLQGILNDVFHQMRKVYPNVPNKQLQEDLEIIMDTFEAVIHGEIPQQEIGLLSIGEYAPHMTAPHRMDLMVSAMTKNGSWHCNQKCLHCYAAGQSLSETEELSTKEWKEIIAACRKAKIPQLTFTGGEPTLREDLCELIAEAKWFVTRLNTNGVLLTPALCQSLMEAELDSVQVTFYSADKAVHNELVGAETFDKTVDGIENAAASSGIQFEEISFNGNASFVKGGFIEMEDGTTQEIVNAENFYLLEIKLKSITDYKQLWSFLKSCEDSGFYVTVDHIDIADEKSNGARLEGEVQVNFYSVVSIEMAENAKK